MLNSMVYIYCSRIRVTPEFVKDRHRRLLISTHTAYRLLLGDYIGECFVSLTDLFETRRYLFAGQQQLVMWRMIRK